MHYCCRCSADLLTLSCVVVCCQIGVDLFRCIMNDKRWDGLPIVLETPCKTEAKEAAKRKKKALAAGEAVEEADGGDEEEEEGDDDDGDDDGGESGGRKGKGKGRGKGTAKAPKEKEDWVKSYSDEIDLLYGLEDGHRGADSAVKKEEGVQVKREKKEAVVESGEEEEAVSEVVVAVMKEEVVVKAEAVGRKQEGQKAIRKRGKASKAATEDAGEDDGDV